MPLIKIVNSVPECYPNQSRDFQLIGRLYDCIINGVKFDIDTIENLTNTQECSERILQLLQTKLGFYTKHSISDDSIRYILRAFPFLVKNKGSKRSLYQAVYIFLKLNHILTEPVIVIRNNEQVAPYTITIYIQSLRIDTTPLDEMLRYLLPTGYTYEYVFYTGLGGTDIAKSSINAELIYVTDNVNSRLRDDTKGKSVKVNGTDTSLSDETDLLIGAVDTTEIIKPDEMNIKETLVIEQLSEDNNE